MSGNVFEIMEKKRREGVLVGVVAINQYDNGMGDLVDDGNFEKVTFTVEVQDDRLYDMLYAASHDTLKDALGDGLENVEEGFSKEDMKEEELFERHERLVKEGKIVQVTYNVKEELEDGKYLFDYRVEVMDDDMEEEFYNETFETFEEALEKGTQFAEGLQ